MKVFCCPETNTIYLQLRPDPVDDCRWEPGLCVEYGEDGLPVGLEWTAVSG